MRVLSFAATDVGRRRHQNEDNYLVDKSLGLFMVCDGMGGHAAGDVASRSAVEHVAKYLRDRSAAIVNAEMSPSRQVDSTGFWSWPKRRCSTRVPGCIRRLAAIRAALGWERR